MSLLLDLALHITRSWVSAYTRGLPHDVRAERREEIDCDLWHQRQLAELERPLRGAAAASVILRLILGVPDDIFWRIQAGYTHSKWRNNVNESLRMRIGFLAAILPLALFFAFGVSFLLGNGDWENNFEHWLWRAAFVAFPAVGAAGLWLCARQPRLGLALTLVGVGASAFLMPWALFVTVPIGFAIIVFSFVRSGLRLWPFRAGPPAAA